MTSKVERSRSFGHPKIFSATFHWYMTIVWPFLVINRSIFIWFWLLCAQNVGLCKSHISSDLDLLSGPWPTFSWKSFFAHNSVNFYPILIILGSKCRICKDADFSYLHLNSKFERSRSFGHRKIFSYISWTNDHSSGAIGTSGWVSFIVKAPMASRAKKMIRA